ncbi:MAG: DNA primase DnaG [Candidatus Hadarchaeum sp.]|uniref:DNA primase DnaG n=1 Tax=Candidatus Hadarchaeum sp. TaxID=2883567 RepID=UPI0031814263
MGAIFGQTEGLFGDVLDLKKLQKSGKLGRIDVDLRVEDKKTIGTVTIPNNLDQPTAALLAATLESIDRVGPYDAKFKLLELEDVREEKRKKVMERAKDIMQRWTASQRSEVIQMISQVSEASEVGRIVSLAPDVEGGPEAESSNALFIVEGRADLTALLKAGIKNIVATNGVNIPQYVVNLTHKKKEVTVLADGDRVGDMIVRELLRRGAKIDYVSKAPQGVEVEEMKPIEILDLISKKVDLKTYLAAYAPVKQVVPEKLLNKASELKDKIKETFTAVLLDAEGEIIEETPVNQLFQRLNELDDVAGIVFDGIVSQRLLDLASEKDVKLIIGERIGSIEKKPTNIIVKTLDELK